MPRRTPLTLSLVVTVSLLAACGSANTTATSRATSGGTNGGTSQAPVTITNCGRPITVTRPLQRAVTTEQAPTETMLALGLQDRMVGTSNIKTEILPELRAAYDTVPVLTPKILTPEQTLSARPDIVVSSYASLLSKDRSGTRDELAAKGVATYLFEGECPKGTKTATDPIEAVYTDITNLGTLFGVKDRATALVAERKKAVAQQATRKPVGKAPRLAWIYSAYDGLPYVGGNDGIPQAVTAKLGAVNVFADVDDHWPEVQWEQLAARNPDVFVIADLSGRGRPGDRPEDKIKTLKENPATASLPAVKEGRFVVVPGSALDASIRFPEVIKTVGDDLVRRGYLR